MVPGTGDLMPENIPELEGEDISPDMLKISPAEKLLTKLRQGKAVVCKPDEIGLMDALESYMTKKVKCFRRLKDTAEEGFSEKELREMIKEDLPKAESTKVEKSGSDNEEEFGADLLGDLLAFEQARVSLAKSKTPGSLEKYPRYQKRDLKT